MSKLILVCNRDSSIPDFTSKAQTLFKRLLPPDIQPHPPLISNSQNLHWAILNPSPVLTYHEDSVCLGTIFDRDAFWWQQGQSIPDGNFAIFRNTDTAIEVVTDMLGTRTVWYYFDHEQLIISTSQRSIVYFLGSYEPNPEVQSWFLFSGNQGPELSWDKRIKYLPGNSRLFLDRDTWTLDVETYPLTLNPSDHVDTNFEEEYESALRDSLSKIKLNPENCAMLLSGGYDSRGLCYFLPEAQKMTGITWGKATAIYSKRTDPYIAIQIAKKLKMNFRFLNIKNSASEFEEMINRFLINGECRTDKISGYMDLFVTWKNIFESGFDGIIRGDHTFDYRKSSSEFETRYIYSLILWEDYKGMELLKPFGLAKQVIPEKLKQQPGESFSNWGGRLDRMFYIPVIQAALADLKLGYVENINPYINKSLIERLGALPEKVHIDKQVLKKIIGSVNPDIPFATSQGLTEEKSFIKQPKVIRYIQESLMNNHSTGSFPQEMKAMIVEEIKRSMPKSYGFEYGFLFKIKKAIQYYIPTNFKNSIKKPKSHLNADFPRLGFRIVLIEKMHELLLEDASIINKNFVDQPNHESSI
ncbi:MAG: hypothetical protein R3D00_16020 [Bacteroidia bacterium]